MGDIKGKRGLLHPKYGNEKVLQWVLQSGGGGVGGSATTFGKLKDGEKKTRGGKESKTLTAPGSKKERKMEERATVSFSLIYKRACAKGKAEV